MNKPTLFFDGGCPLCQKEIAHYQKLDSDARVEWIDITQDRDRLASLDLSYQQTMRYIHGVTSEGEIQKGVSAFVMVWNELPYYRWLAKIVTALKLQSALDFLYLRFADWRFKRRCASGACRID